MVAKMAESIKAMEGVLDKIAAALGTEKGDVFALGEALEAVVVRAKERDELLDMTMMLDCHPEEYDGPCMCQECMNASQ